MKFKVATMSYQEALVFMGLRADFTAEDLKKNYRSRALTYHPDMAGEDPAEIQKFTELTKKLNEARAILEGSDKYVPNFDEPVQEDRWEKFRAEMIRQNSPQPPPTERNLEDLVSFVIHNELFQLKIREPVSHIPATSFLKSDRKQYSSPFGSVKRTMKLKSPTRENIEKIIREAHSHGKLFDVGYHRNLEAWVTIHTKNKNYPFQSISFEKPKTAKPKVPGVGMKKDEIENYLRSKGLSKKSYTAGDYWSFGDDLFGKFIRIKNKSVRLVRRRRNDADMGIENERYFGEVSIPLLDEMVVRIST